MSTKASVHLETQAQSRLPRILLAIFVPYWLVWAYQPLLLSDWILENVLQVLGIGVLILTHRRYPLSNLSYFLIFIFSCLHTIGTHYSYSEVPYNEWSRALIGSSVNDIFGFTRNHYDRLMHFLFGLLLTLPLREWYLMLIGGRGLFSYIIPLNFTMSVSLFYELVEWTAAEVFGGDLGVAFLGIQGDIWDAQKDMALACMGGVICMMLAATASHYHSLERIRKA